MGLFLQTLKKQVQRMHQNKFESDRRPQPFLMLILCKELKRQKRSPHIIRSLTLTHCDYGGRWDILQAVNKLTQAGKTEITESDLAAELMLAEAPEPDLLTVQVARCG